MEYKEFDSRALTLLLLGMCPRFYMQNGLRSGLTLAQGSQPQDNAPNRTSLFSVMPLPPGASNTSLSSKFSFHSLHSLSKNLKTLSCPSMLAFHLPEQKLKDLLSPYSHSVVLPKHFSLPNILVSFFSLNSYCHRPGSGFNS